MDATIEPQDQLGFLSEFITACEGLLGNTYPNAQAVFSAAASCLGPAAVNVNGIGELGSDLIGRLSIIKQCVPTTSYADELESSTAVAVVVESVAKLKGAVKEAVRRQPFMHSVLAEVATALGGVPPDVAATARPPAPERVIEPEAPASVVRSGGLSEKPDAAGNVIESSSLAIQALREAHDGSAQPALAALLEACAKSPAAL